MIKKSVNLTAAGKKELEKEKGIKKEYVLGAIETALVTAYKRNFESSDNVRVEMDRQTGATYVFSVKEVVEEVKKEFEEKFIKFTMHQIKNRSLA